MTKRVQCLPDYRLDPATLDWVLLECHIDRKCMLFVWKQNNLKDDCVFNKMTICKLIHFPREVNVPKTCQRFCPLRNMYHLISKYGMKDCLILEGKMQSVSIIDVLCAVSTWYIFVLMMEAGHLLSLSTWEMQDRTEGWWTPIMFLTGVRQVSYAAQLSQIILSTYL